MSEADILRRAAREIRRDYADWTHEEDRRFYLAVASLLDEDARWEDVGEYVTGQALEVAQAYLGLPTSSRADRSSRASSTSEATATNSAGGGFGGVSAKSETAKMARPNASSSSMPHSLPCPTDSGGEA